MKVTSFIQAIEEFEKATGSPRLCLVYDRSEVVKLRDMVNRALNTLDPRDWPPFMRELDDAIDKFLASTSPGA